ncbi:hypothetical protein QE400_000054 [Xanthomonas sacchari]|uniref:hypothetical protein n=1 Tax=Xanthomonas sacchari TaxID=56458 RepID=UPI00278035AB|nr:hypothetical protein [Xanthomonas sacchari]MDQ1090641.1 hypothetical protein [Xanthomonas sacchari]
MAKTDPQRKAKSTSGDVGGAGEDRSGMALTLTPEILALALPAAGKAYSVDGRAGKLPSRVYDALIAGWRAMLAARAQEVGQRALPPLPPPRYRMASSGTPSDAYSLEQMQDYARAALADGRPEVSATTQAVIDMLVQRDQAGRVKYGETMDRTDLSRAEWLQHLTEELLDGACYAQAAKRKGAKRV